MTREFCYTSIRIDKQVWKALKKTAIDRDMEYFEALEEAIKNWVVKK
ncbi:MAG: hypothetical protein ACHQ1D_11985 [Nitrososphaerales archaeon]